MSCKHRCPSRTLRLPPSESPPASTCDLATGQERLAFLDQRPEPRQLGRSNNAVRKHKAIDGLYLDRPGLKLEANSKVSLTFLPATGSANVSCLRLVYRSLMLSFRAFFFGGQP